MSDEPSPWPERRRTQALLFAAGAACMLPSAVEFGGLADLGGTFVVGTSAVGSALLIYGLLGWGGQWAAPDEEMGGDGEAGDAAGDAGDADAEQPSGDADDGGDADDEEAGDGAGDDPPDGNGHEPADEADGKPAEDAPDA